MSYRIAVVGLGKIGLPLAVQAAGSQTVVGCDISPRVVEMVNSGTPPFPGEAHLDERLAEVVEAGRLTATTATAEGVAQSDVVIVVVPLVVDDRGVPDFSIMDAATREVGKALRPGTLVSYETTLPVGTTRNRFAPMLEELSGLKAGVSFNLVHSPERVFTGRVFADLRRYPKLLGGLTDKCAAAGRAFYESILEFDDRPDLEEKNGVWDLGSVEAAELAKLVETTYRDVNIALANEFANYAGRIGVDIGPVIEAANSQPFSHVHRPGIAVGGHCIPVYPRFYLAGDPLATLPAAARSVNESMPARAVEAVEGCVGSLEGKRAAILGVAYRGGVKETAFSGAFPLAEALAARGAIVTAHDPLYSDEELISMGFSPHTLGEETDVVFVQADHREYRQLTVEDVPGCEVIYDGRQIIESVGSIPILGPGRSVTGDEPSPSS